MKYDIEYVDLEKRRGNLVPALDLALEMEKSADFKDYSHIGRLYEYGVGGIRQDLDKAKYYYEKGIEKFNDAESLLRLGRFYRDGVSVKKDPEYAVKLFKIASDLYDHEFANYLLGIAYYTGVGTKVDYGMSKNYFERAGRRGHCYSFSYWGSLEMKQGNFIRGFFIKCRALVYMVGLMIKMRHKKVWQKDPRFRTKF